MNMKTNKLLIGLLLVGSIFTAYGQRSTKVTKQINELNKQIKALEDKIIPTLEDLIKSYDNQMTKLEGDLRLKENVFNLKMTVQGARYQTLFETTKAPGITVLQKISLLNQMKDIEATVKALKLVWEAERNQLDSLHDAFIPKKKSAQAKLDYLREEVDLIKQLIDFTEQTMMPRGLRKAARFEWLKKTRKLKKKEIKNLKNELSSLRKKIASLT